MPQNAQLAKLCLFYLVANSSGKLAKDPLAWRDASLANDIIFVAETHVAAAIFIAALPLMPHALTTKDKFCLNMPP